MGFSSFVSKYGMQCNNAYNPHIGKETQPHAAKHNPMTALIQQLK